MKPTEEQGHERTDANVRAVTLLARRAAEHDRPQSPIAAVAPETPPEPRLQTAPAKDLAALRAEEDTVLGSYGWVDRGAGVVRIPIERAKKLVAEETR